jgi:hypothetical protein
MAASDALVLASPMPPQLMGDFAPAVGAICAVLLAYIYARGRKIRRVPEE